MLPLTSLLEKICSPVPIWSFCKWTVLSGQLVWQRAPNKYWELMRLPCIMLKDGRFQQKFWLRLRFRLQLSKKKLTSVPTPTSTGQNGANFSLDSDPGGGTAHLWLCCHGKESNGDLNTLAKHSRPFEAQPEPDCFLSPNLMHWL